jgi:nucleosome assembly protein 1-like 1
LQILPHAIDYFTGKALEYDDIGLDDAEEDDDEFDDDDEEEEEEDEDEVRDLCNMLFGLIN